MHDIVKSYIYDNDIKLKIAFINKSIEEISKAQNFSEEEKSLFASSALFAAIYATEQKDDKGSVYASFKYPKQRLSLTAVCETDGRLRGYSEEYSSSTVSENEVLLVAGIRLAVRGEYQSAVVADNPEDLVSIYYKNSNQTKAKVRFIEKDGIKALIVAEYLPGHYVNYKTDDKKPNTEMIDKKLKSTMNIAYEIAMAEIELYKISSVNHEKIKQLADIEISFGCTCSKRKIKEAIISCQEDIELPFEATCKLCGKVYTINEI